MIKRFNKVHKLRSVLTLNQVSGWVATEIVKTEKLKDRVGVLAKFLEIADVLFREFSRNLF